MTSSAQRVQRTYLALTLLSTLAASFIWGINTRFVYLARRENATSDPITADTDESETVARAA